MTSKKRNSANLDNEVSVASARASVLLYNEQSKKWVPSGSSSGLSKVHIYQHTLNGTFRIVGRKLDDHEVVINSAILRGFKYNQATPTFHQWRDQRTIYGLNFSSKDDAEHFAHAMTNALEQLANPGAAIQPPPLPPQAPPTAASAAPQPPQPPSSTPIYQTPVEMPHSAQQQPNPPQPPPMMNNGGAPPPPPPPMPMGHVRNPSTNGSPYGAPVPPSGAPPAPPAPPPMPSSAPIPPAPPAPMGGAPPPPPPPPPPGALSGGDSAGSNSLLAALSSVKLKKTSPPVEGGSRDSADGNSHLQRKQSTGNPMASMLDEMQGTLAKRRAQAEKKSAATALFQDGKAENNGEHSNGASNGGNSNCKTWSPGQNGVVKRSDQQSGETSPKSQRKQRMGSLGDMDGIKMNGDANGGTVLDNEQMERLKNEILNEMKKHMNKVKDEIITAIRQEINRR